jgi:hypothetical protein
MPRKPRQCWQTTIADLPITLEQLARDRFRVTYWKQVKSDLSYGEAASELGACIMHALACEGKLDNG